MPSRIVREGILESDRVQKLLELGGWEAEVFYRRLHQVVDDYGRYPADPKLLRPRMYPLALDQMREANVSRCLSHCEAAGLVRLYRVGDKQYLEVLDFNQRTRAKVSKCPEPASGESVTAARPSHDSHSTAETNADSETNAKAKAAKPVVPEDVPEPLSSSPAFMSAWADWQSHRKEKKEPLTPTSRRLQLRKLAEWGPSRAVAALNNSMANGWTGIFEPSAGKGNGATQELKRIDKPRTFKDA